MRKKEKAVAAVERLEKVYPDAICSLDYREKDAFQLLIATRLSAQCTDKRVNTVTPVLFAEYGKPSLMAKADVSHIEEIIKTCGLYKTKAKDLVLIGKILTEKYGEKVPDSIDELIKLPGIGRKTANLVCGDIYGKPAVVTDTHFIRLSNRLGLVSTDNPLKVEKEMRELLPPEKSNDFCHRTVLFGRDTCTARNPKCGNCVLYDLCVSKGKGAEK